MRKVVWISLLALLAAGCGRDGAKGGKPAGGRTGKPKVEVTPDTAITGRVASVNANGGFVVLNFPVGWMPAVDRQLAIYRKGQKVGEVRVTGPQREYNIAADLVAGEAKLDDEVRER